MVVACSFAAIGGSYAPDSRVGKEGLAMHAYIQCMMSLPCITMPIYSRAVSGYPVGDLVKILLSSDVTGRKVCTVQLLGVWKCYFHRGHRNCWSSRLNNLGSWHPSGTKKSYYRLSSDGILRVSEEHPCNMPSDYYILTHRYYTHKSYVIVWLQISEVSYACIIIFDYLIGL